MGVGGIPFKNSSAWQGQKIGFVARVPSVPYFAEGFGDVVGVGFENFLRDNHGE